MIELLIVIAVLGILAVAVISAINPIEQINRSYDTGSRSDAEQMIGALDRFYASKQYYAWQGGATDTVNVVNGNLQPVGQTALTNAMLINLSGATGELKDAFITKVSSSKYNWLYVYNKGGTNNSTYVCFMPKSNTFKDDATKRCEGGLPSDVTDISDDVCNHGATINNSMACLP